MTNHECRFYRETKRLGANGKASKADDVSRRREKSKRGLYDDEIIADTLVVNLTHTQSHIHIQSRVTIITIVD